MARGFLYFEADGTAVATIYGGGKPYGSRIVNVSPEGVLSEHGNSWPSHKDIEFADEAELLNAIAAEMAPAGQP